MNKPHDPGVSTDTPATTRASARSIQRWGGPVKVRDLGLSAKVKCTEAGTTRSAAGAAEKSLNSEKP
jgi:hypothetical protein